MATCGKQIVVAALASLLIITTSCPAENLDSTKVLCYDRLIEKLPDDQPITLHLTDNSVVRGVHPLAMTPISTLHLWRADDTSFVRSLNIPYDKIHSFSYKKSSPVRYALVLSGLVGGMYAGAAIGSCSRQSSRGPYFPNIALQTTLGILAGLAGAVIGSELGKQFSSTVTLSCP